MENKDIEDRIYQEYIKMRKSLYDYQDYKYDNIDRFIYSEDFEYGFKAGIKVMLSIFLEK